MSEDDALLAKIGQLAGQINQHKNQAPPSHHPNRGGYSIPSYGNTNYNRNGTGWAPYRGSGRGAPRGRARGATSHRNRTLVINGNTAASDDSADISSLNPSLPNNTTEGNPTPSAGWIAKRDRHMQLINSNIYEQETQARSKAIEETRRIKAQQRDDRELAKVNKYLHDLHSPQSNSTAYDSTPKPNENKYEIMIQDLPFRVANGGSKLIRDSTLANSANKTPKEAVVGGVTFVRSKNGNLYRLGAVKSKRKEMGIKKKNELCKRFTTSGTCLRGPSCPYVHDPNKVAICRDFLSSGQCPAGDSCDLSHEPSPERSPACMHFLRGRCTNPTCRYSHIRVNPAAPICRPFAYLGYCEKGANCNDRHVHECPDYSGTGTCPNKKCRLPHIDRAGQIRKNAANKSTAEGTDSSMEEDPEDISSEEDEYEEIGSDDIDSDDMDEPAPMVIPNVGESSSLSQQQDFIHF